MAGDTKRHPTPRVRPAMVTLHDEESTEAARQAMQRGSEPPPAILGERTTMPAPPPALGRYSIELVAAEDVDFRALFEHGDFRGALLACRERLAVSPADTTALRIAQRSEETLCQQMLEQLGGEHVEISLGAAPARELMPRERAVIAALASGSRVLSTLFANVKNKPFDVLEALIQLRTDGVVLVNLSDQKSTNA